MTNIIIHGANGFMGQVVANMAKADPDITVVCGIDKFPDARENGFPVYENFSQVTEKADTLIDFSRPNALPAILDFAEKTNTAAVLCTTGYSKDDQALIKKKSQTCTLFQSANMSLGVNIQMNLIRQVADFFGHDFDIEIVEKHHNRKVDAPSGTALALADAINKAFNGDMNYVCGRHTNEDKREKNDIGIHAVRGGTVVGEHDVSFYGNDEVITVKHTALSRQVFAAGAIRAAKFIDKLPAGLYHMQDIISHQHIITNMYFDLNQAMITISDIPGDAVSLASVFDALGDSNANLDIITQSTMPDGDVTLTFSLSKTELEKAKRAMTACLNDLDGAAIIEFDDVTKITVEGIGMERQPGVGAKLFSALALDGISIKAISTSETKISFCVKSEDSKNALKIISDLFDV